MSLNIIRTEVHIGEYVSYITIVIAVVSVDIKDKNIYLTIDKNDTLNYNEFIELLNNDNCGNLMSINNNINNDIELLDYFKNSDFSIRPVYNLFNNYDIIIGNEKSSSFYEYNLH